MVWELTFGSTALLVSLDSPVTEGSCSFGCSSHYEVVNWSRIQQKSEHPSVMESALVYGLSHFAFSLFCDLMCGTTSIGN